MPVALLVAALVLIILGLSVAPAIVLWIGVALGVVALVLFLIGGRGLRL